MNNTICAIGFYYGQFNNYFSLFLKSCGCNPSIDFIIVTDISIKGYEVPSNVKFISMTMAEAKTLASNKLKIDVQIPRPYKFCDLKPFYGVILGDYISQYEYWGWYDFDIIYGDVYSHMIHNNYQQYDKFLPMGHLSFVRNTDKVNNYYKLQCSDPTIDYKRALTTPDNVYFDENCGYNQLILSNNIPFYTRRLFADITPMYHRFTISEACSLDGYYAKNYKYQVFYWKHGKIYRDYYEDGKIKTDEFMYIHLQKRPNFLATETVVKSDEFYITPNGFVEKKTPTTLDDIRQLNPYLPFGDKCTLHHVKFMWHLKMDWRINNFIKKLGLK